MIDMLMNQTDYLSTIQEIKAEIQKAQYQATVAGSDSPSALLSKMSDTIVPLKASGIKANTEKLDEIDSNGVFQNYLHYFAEHKFWEDK